MMREFYLTSNYMFFFHTFFGKDFPYFYCSLWVFLSHHGPFGKTRPIRNRYFYLLDLFSLNLFIVGHETNADCIIRAIRI